MDPAVLFQPVEGGEERSGFYDKHAARDLTDAVGNAQAVHGAEREGSQHQHVERALQDFGRFRHVPIDGLEQYNASRIDGQ